MKLWQKEQQKATTAETTAFTVGNDRHFDLLLAPYDIQGTLAHIQMLHKVDLMNREDLDALSHELEAIMEEIKSGNFKISDEAEDIHSQIEYLLTQKLGEAGMRIHTARSRNDQVALDIKLYLRDAILSIRASLDTLFRLLQELSEKHKNALLPGYTHMQIGMPSSFGIWFGAWAECLVDDLELLAACYSVANKNPLGSGAGYGSSLPIDREETTKLLGFRTMHYNVAAAQMSRGRTERMLASGLAGIASTLGRMCMDICLFVGQNHGFISFPEELTTGSSIMPHKKNPDLFELVRGHCNRIQSLPNELSLLLTNLPSGYHRDIQLTKEILFPGIESLLDCIRILIHALPQMQVKDHILKDEKYKFLFSVEAVNALVNSGMSFREAYRQIGTQIQLDQFTAPAFEASTHTHSGSMGNLCNNQICKEWELVMDKFGV